MRETQVRSLGWEDPLEKEMAIHSSTIAWKIPCIERSLVGYSLWGRKESNTTERLHFTSLRCYFSKKDWRQRDWFGHYFNSRHPGERWGRPGWGQPQRGESGGEGESRRELSGHVSGWCGGRWLPDWVVLGPAEAGHLGSEQFWGWRNDCSFRH